MAFDHILQDPAALAAAALIPARARAAGVDTWAGYCALNDSEAVAHLDPATASQQLRKRAGRHPVPVLEADGTLSLLIPVHFKGAVLTARATLSDWLLLQEGGYRGLWCANANGDGRLVVKAARPMSGHGKANQQPVARVILDCGPKFRVQFVNGDSLDLRRPNLRRADRADGRLTQSRALARQGIALIPKG